MDYIPNLISIIVPVFNVKDYLDRCLQSIVNQTYPQIEIIIVDDGSTDGSGELCDKWGRHDSRIRVFHKENGGLSSARNVGLDASLGEYIGFIDSDDYIGLDMYSSLLANFDEEVDLVCCGGVILYPNRMRKQKKLFCNTSKGASFSNREAIKELLLDRALNFSACNKLFRRDLFNGIRFPVGKVSEDIPVTYEVIKRCRSVVSTGEIKYFYCYRSDSISKKNFTIGKMSYLLFSRDIYKDIVLNYPNEKKYGEALYITSVINIYRDIMRCPDGDRYEQIQKRLRKFLRCMFSNILLNQYITKFAKKEAFKYLF